MKSSHPRKPIFSTNAANRPQSPYLADLLDAYRDKPFAPGVYAVLVRHDDWCRLLTNRGPCNCHPDIEIQGRRS